MESRRVSGSTCNHFPPELLRRPQESSVIYVFICTIFQRELLSSSLNCIVVCTRMSPPPFCPTIRFHLTSVASPPPSITQRYLYQAGDRADGLYVYDCDDNRNEHIPSLSSCSKRLRRDCDDTDDIPITVVAVFRFVPAFQRYLFWYYNQCTPFMCVRVCVCVCFLFRPAWPRGPMAGRC